MQKSGGALDLGIAGRRALVCASSRGLGRSCAEALAAEGVHVVLNARGAEGLDAAVADLSARFDVEITGVRGDVSDTATREALLDACPGADILVTNNAGPAPAEFAACDRDDWMGALEANMVAPLMLIRSVIAGMVDRRFGRIINVTSAMVTSPHPSMGLSSGARAGLTAAVKGLSRAVARDNVTINNLLPERIDTDRQIYMAQQLVDQEGISFEEARARQIGSIAAGRLGRPEEFGAACAFLCSAHAGFISGNNVHLDGGSYVGLV